MVKILSESELKEILKSAKSNNLDRGITGILVARNGAFLQFLEGDINRVTEVFNRIKKDIRHKNIEVLINESADRMIFPNWAMGMVDESKLSMSIPEAYSMIDLILKQEAILIDPKDKILEILKIFSTNASTFSALLK